MLIKFPFCLGFVYAGRDPWRNYEASVEFGFGRRPNCPKYELNYRITGHLSWDWLPVRLYELTFVPGSADLCAAAWTGRYRRLVGLERWRRSFGVTRIRGARKQK